MLFALTLEARGFSERRPHMTSSRCTLGKRRCSPDRDLLPSTTPNLKSLAMLLTLGVVGFASIAAVTPKEVPADAERYVRDVAPRGSLQPDELHLTQLFQQASKSVVHITSLRLQRFTRRDVYRVPEGSGSGFVWDTSGHVVTNFHVVQRGQEFQVVLADESSWSAELVGAAPHKDLAVLKIDAPREILEPMALGSSKDLLVGQNTYAIGNPFGLDQSLTRGVISALGREITSRMRTTIYDVIQSDTAVNPGNSGGPLLDSAGRLIGVNTAIFSPSGASAGISFAVPADTVRRIVPDLIAFGRVQKPVIGFRPYPNNLPRDFPDGVLVADVPNGTALERAGLRGTTERSLGDIIVAVNGRPTPSLADLESVLERFRAGDEVQLTLIRGLGYDGEGGQSVTIETLLQAADPGKP